MKVRKMLSREEVIQKFSEISTYGDRDVLAMMEATGLILGVVLDIRDGLQEKKSK